MAKGLRFIHHILGVLPEQRNQKLVLCFSQNFDDLLVTRVVYVNVQLLEQHHILLLLRVLAPILEQKWFLKEVLRSNGWHFRSASLPLGLDKDFTEDVCLFLQLLLFLFFILSILHLFLLGL